MSPQVSSGSPLLAVAERLKRILSRAAVGSDTLDEFPAKPLAKRTVSRASSSGRLDSFPAQPQAFLYKLLSSQFCVFMFVVQLEATPRNVIIKELMWIQLHTR